ncbi:MAG: hypothetical protein Q4B60_06930 [Erysipelotrichaceae bacterium]|nr:hypothetical protein [Erysipelotrichaceae bacterium]
MKVLFALLLVAVSFAVIYFIVKDRRMTNWEETSILKKSGFNRVG